MPFVLPLVTKSLFFQDLYKIHQEIFSDLQKAVDSESASDIARIFIKSKKRMVLYAEYCAGLPTAQNKVDELMKKNDITRHTIQVSTVRLYH